MIQFVTLTDISVNCGTILKMFNFTYTTLGITLGIIQLREHISTKYFKMIEI